MVPDFITVFIQQLLVLSSLQGGFSNKQKKGMHRIMNMKYMTCSHNYYINVLTELVDLIGHQFYL